ncbi:hypothetical protein LSAT2_023463 [Lamellibrachia satsuma]|nr:hypothetical protein LSAT2_023463 [Lamellibrachia satsuma]
MRASEDAMTNTFTILETWIDSKNDVGNVTALFDQLSGACLNIKRADMVDIVRCEQLQQQNEKLKKAKETAQSWKTRSNEQMKVVKVELRQIKDELQQNKDEMQQTKEELRKSKVEEESNQARKLRALRVMSMLRGYGEPGLWGHVSQQFVKEGQLDLSSVLSRTNLPDLLYLLQSDAASDITKLYLSHNAVFADEEAGRALGDGLAKMSTLCGLQMVGCSLTDRSWARIVDGIIRGCRQLNKLQ